MRELLSISNRELILVVATDIAVMGELVFRPCLFFQESMYYLKSQNQDYRINEKLIKDVAQRSSLKKNR